MRRNLCGGILVLALLAGAAGTSCGAGDRHAHLQGAVPGLHQPRVRGVDLRSGRGREPGPGGVLPLRPWGQRLQPPRRVRRPERVGGHAGPARRRLPDAGRELQRELPARRLAHARARGERRRRRRRVLHPGRHLARPSLRSRGVEHHLRALRAPGHRPHVRRRRQRRELRPRAWAWTSASASSGRSARAAASATSRASASAWPTFTDTRSPTRRPAADCRGRAFVVPVRRD